MVDSYNMYSVRESMICCPKPTDSTSRAYDLTMTVRPEKDFKEVVMADCSQDLSGGEQCELLIIGFVFLEMRHAH